MVFRDKPPYSYLREGKPTGFLFERAARIMKAAGIPVRWREMPPKRIFRELQANTRRVCSFGWYRTAQRERFARYSRAIHRDRPHRILAGPHAIDRIRRHQSLASLMADASLTLGVVDGVSYGDDLDARIAGFPGDIDKSLQSPIAVARKVALQRADFMFIDHDDYDYLIGTDQDFKAQGLTVLSYAGMPPGLERHILCSRKVGTEEISRIDSAIAEVMQLHEPPPN